jgi:hypothetical protein
VPDSGYIGLRLNGNPPGSETQKKPDGHEATGRVLWFRNFEVLRR